MGEGREEDLSVVDASALTKGMQEASAFIEKILACSVGRRTNRRSAPLSADDLHVPVVRCHGPPMLIL